MKRITPISCSEKEFRLSLAIPEKTKNESSIQYQDSVNTRKRKAMMVQDKIVYEHKNGSSLT